jgi:hypothetical protein
LDRIDVNEHKLILLADLLMTFEWFTKDTDAFGVGASVTAHRNQFLPSRHRVSFARVSLKYTLSQPSNYGTFTR